MQPQMNSRVDDHRPMTNRDMKGELIPIRDLVYIDPQLITEQKTASGLIMPAPKRQGPPNTGKVLAVGPDVKDIKAGDEVVFIDANAKGFWLNNIAHIPLKEEQIVAKIIKGKK